MMLNATQWMLAGVLGLDKDKLRLMGLAAAREFVKQDVLARMERNVPTVAGRLNRDGYTLGTGLTSVRGYTAPFTVHYIREAQFRIYRTFGAPALVADALRDAHDDRVVPDVERRVTVGMSAQQVVRMVVYAEVELLF